MKTIHNQLSAATIDMVKAGIIRNQARVIDLLKWDLAIYSAFMYNSGLKYLEVYTGRDNEAIGKLSPVKEFWSWWKTRWNARDEKFINEWDGREDETTPEDLRKLYQEFHNPKVLACDTAIPSSVYPDSFPVIKMEMA